MAITQKDKIDLLGNVKKVKINDFSDLLISSKSNISYEEYLDTFITIFKKFLNEKSTSKNIYNSVLAIKVTLGEMYSLNIELQKDLYSKLTKVKEEYLKYVSDNNLNADKNTVDIIEDIILLTISSEIDNYIKNGEIEEKQEEIKEVEVSNNENNQELLDRIKELEKELKQVKKVNQKQKTSLDKKSEEIKELKSSMKEKNTHIASLEKQVLKSDKALEKAMSKSEELDEELKNAQDEVIRLRSDKEKYLTSEKVVNEKYEQILVEERKAKIEYEVFKILTTGRKTINDILKECNSDLDCGYMDVYNAIIGLKNRYSIECVQVRNNEIVYDLVNKNVKTNRKLDLCGEVKRILFISDLHIGSFSNYDEKTMYAVYDYAVANGINLIINLGDLFSYSYQSGTTKLNRIDYNKMILDTFISRYPYDIGIKNLILGGNHDLYITSYSIDPLEYIERNRNDIISLGYDHAILNINGDRFALHHPKRKFEVDEYGRELTESIISYLDTYYETSNFNREDICLDILGHIHKSILTNSDILIVPSLTQDRVQNGACYMEIEYENSKIKNIIISPLIFNNYSLIKTSELVYKKR